MTEQNQISIGETIFDKLRFRIRQLFLGQISNCEQNQNNIIKIIDNIETSVKIDSEMVISETIKMLEDIIIQPNKIKPIYRNIATPFLITFNGSLDRSIKKLKSMQIKENTESLTVFSGLSEFGKNRLKQIIENEYLDGRIIF